jgi:recyclin-1
MDGWATLEPTKLYASPTPQAASASSSRNNNKIKTQQAFVGRLPIDIHLLIIEYLPLPDIPSYARCARSTAGFARGENFWEVKYCRLLGDAKAEEFSSLLDSLGPKQDTSKPALIAAESLDDEFGEFTIASSSTSYAIPSPAIIPTNSHRGRFIRAYNLLKPLTNVLSLPPHQVLSSLPQMTVLNQALLLSTLSRFLSPSLQPVRAWKTLAASLRAAIDRFDATLLAAFDSADTSGDEEAMRTAASASWTVWPGVSTDWEMGKVWAEKREIFYEQGRWEPKDNLCVFYVPVY